MNVLAAVMIGLAVNLDNLVIGLNFGVKHHRISVLSNALMSLITGVFAFLSTYLAGMLSSMLFSTTNLIGAVLIILFGAYCLCTSLFRPASPFTEPRGLSLPELVGLGVLLAVNCVPPSLSAGVIGLNAGLVGTFSGVFSFLCLLIGNRLGDKLGKLKCLHMLEYLSSILLIAIGVMELII